MIHDDEGGEDQPVNQDLAHSGVVEWDRSDAHVRWLWAPFRSTWEPRSPEAHKQVECAARLRQK